VINHFMQCRNKTDSYFSPRVTPFNLQLTIFGAEASFITSATL